MSDQPEATPQQTVEQQPAVQGGAPNTEATIESLTQRIEQQELLIGRLRGVEKELTKAAKRGEKLEGIAKAQLDAMKQNVPDGVLAELDGLHLDKQWAIVSALVGGGVPRAAQDAPPDPEPQVAPGAPVVAPPASVQIPEPPRPTVAPALSAYEREREALRAAGRLTQGEWLALMRKHNIQ